jgi:hypothetical protein
MGYRCVGTRIRPLLRKEVVGMKSTTIPRSSSVVVHQAVYASTGRSVIPFNCTKLHTYC